MINRIIYARYVRKGIIISINNTVLDVLMTVIARVIIKEFRLQREINFYLSMKRKITTIKIKSDLDW